MDAIAPDPPEGSSLRGMRRMTLQAFFLAAIWGALPLALLDRVAPSSQMIVACLMAGMIAGGAVTLSTVPRAGLVYTWTLAFASAASLVVAGDKVHLFTAIFLLLFTGFIARNVALARQSVPGKPAGAVQARAPDGDHFAASEGIPGERQRLALANRRRGPADLCPGSFRRSGANSSAASPGRPLLRSAGNALPGRRDNGFEHRRADGTACAAARDQRSRRCRRRDAPVVVHGQAQSRR